MYIQYLHMAPRGADCMWAGQQEAPSHHNGHWRRATQPIDDPDRFVTTCYQVPRDATGSGYRPMQQMQ